MHQPLIKNLEKEFGWEFRKIQSYITPGMLQFKILRPKNKLEVIEANLQSRYISGVSMIINLFNHSRSDIANVVRDLVKCMDGLAAYRRMLHL
jgi:hypothetical protein